MQCKIAWEVTWEMCHYYVGWLNVGVAGTADFGAPESSAWSLEAPIWSLAGIEVGI